MKKWWSSDCFRQISRLLGLAMETTGWSVDQGTNYASVGQETGHSIGDHISFHFSLWKMPWMTPTVWSSLTGNIATSNELFPISCQIEGICCCSKPDPYLPENRFPRRFMLNTLSGRSLILWKLSKMQACQWAYLALKVRHHPRIVSYLKAFCILTW